MADDLSKWAGAGVALLAAGGGYVGSAMDNSKDAGALTQKVEFLTTQLQDHDTRERRFVDSVQAQLADIEARVRVLESRR